jgi:hypothetical protein
LKSWSKRVAAKLLLLQRYMTRGAAFAFAVAECIEKVGAFALGRGTGTSQEM